MTDKDKGGFFSNKQYDFVKFLTVVLLPALGTLYFALAQTWDLPAGEEVLGTLMALQVFIGAVMGISTKAYKDSDARFDGVMTTTDTPKKKIISVETNLHPDELAQKDEVVLKVEPATTSQ